MGVLRVAFPTLVTAMLAVAFTVASATAATTTIDFESLSGPSEFCAPSSGPLPLGIATFSGGAILSKVAGLPADQTTVYGTWWDCPGYAPAITISFASPVSDFSVQVMNGDGVSVSYTVASNTGMTSTQTLASNANSGMATFSIPGGGITSVTITSASAFWDFFIDNVQFIETPAEPTDK